MSRTPVQASHEVLGWRRRWSWTRCRAEAEGVCRQVIASDEVAVNSILLQANTVTHPLPYEHLFE